MFGAPVNIEQIYNISLTLFQQHYILSAWHRKGGHQGQYVQNANCYEIRLRRLLNHAGYISCVT